MKDRDSGKGFYAYRYKEHPGGYDRKIVPLVLVEENHQIWHYHPTRVRQYKKQYRIILEACEVQTYSKCI
jgi:hypothetical protein